MALTIPKNKMNDLNTVDSVADIGGCVYAKAVNGVSAV